MLARLRRHRPSHAVVVAYLALFVALGGSSYAAITVTGKNVKNNSLTGKDVKNGSLLRADLKPGQLPGGAVGPSGPRGAEGPPGADGEPGVAGEAGTARGYGYVHSSGNIVAGYSKNLLRVARANEGVLCLEFAFTPLNVIATLEEGPAGAGGGEVTQVVYGDDGIHCEGPNDAGYHVVIKTRTSAGTLADRSVHVAAN